MFGLKAMGAGAAALAITTSAFAARSAENIDLYYNPSDIDVLELSTFGNPTAVAGVEARSVDDDTFVLDIGNALSRGSVQDIFIEEAFANLIEGNVDVGSRSRQAAGSATAVDFSEVAPSDPILGDTFDWQGTSLAFESATFGTGLGLTSDRLLLTFNYADGVTFDDVAALLGTEGYRVASFAEIDINQRFQIAGVTTAVRNTGSTTVSSVPTPTAAVGGLALLGLAGLRRRSNG